MRAIWIGTAIGIVGLCLCRPASSEDAGIDPSSCGDVNGDAVVNISDALYLLNHLFLGGPSPTCASRPIDPTNGSCSRSADLVAAACRDEALARFRLSSAHCINRESPNDVAECVDSARNEFDDAIAACEAQGGARLEICASLRESPYRPVIDPERFVDAIDHPYFPLVAGTTFLYEKETESGAEGIVVSVLPQRREILGVDCTVVRETESVDGMPVEEKFQWFAQDAEGGVWHFGEKSFELDGDEIVEVEQSWEAGVDGAEPGMLLPAAPTAGEIYRQEYLLAEAEDVARVLSLNAAVEVAHGSFADCIEIEVFSALEPGLSERRIFAPGVGLVLEVDPETGERVELIDVLGGGPTGH